MKLNPAVSSALLQQAEGLISITDLVNTLSANELVLLEKHSSPSGNKYYIIAKAVEKCAVTVTVTVHSEIHLELRK